MDEKSNENNPYPFLNKFWIITIFVYYFFLFLVGMMGTFIILNDKIFINCEISTFTLALCGSISMGLLGSTTFYIRKLYKSCINIYSKKAVNKDCLNSFILIGTVFYYITRPLFSVGFAILVVIGFLSGLFILTTKKIELGQGLIYISMVLSYFTGFLAGQFIKKLESRGNQLINKILQEKDNGNQKN